MKLKPFHFKIYSFIYYHDLPTSLLYLTLRRDEYSILPSSSHARRGCAILYFAEITGTLEYILFIFGLVMKILRRDPAYCQDQCGTDDELKCFLFDPGGEEINQIPRKARRDQDILPDLRSGCVVYYSE